MTLNERFLLAKRKMFDKVYSDLNERQRDAVFTVGGPLLVLAGAGSGKTTVLVRRIAFLIRYGNAYYSDVVPDSVDEEQVTALENMAETYTKEQLQPMLDIFACNPCEPYRVMAITFTNKAAKEIRSRIDSLFSDTDISADDIMTGTFHSVCVRILRKHCDAVGYRQGFSIFDADDSKKAFSEALRRCNIDEKLLSPKTVANAVSRAKDKLLTPEAYEAEAGDDFKLQQIAKVYAEYQQYLRESNALDFDDLIMQTVLLFERNPEIVKSYQKRYKYVCVDEYQDTNIAQFRLTAILAGGYNNLMVVGDDDQSIYRFRGATIENILSFDKTYPTAKVIRLEQNYRSTQNILDAANGVIAKNKGRMGKNLWTSAGEGSKIHLLECEDQNAESRKIVEIVQKSVARGQASYRDFAVLYRTNAQSQNIERTFSRSAVPYRMLGGTRFSDREEIRDALAYLQLIANHDDNLRLNRIINKPRRKLGDKTLATVSAIADEQNCSQFAVIEKAGAFTALAKSLPQLGDFADLINTLTADAEEMSLDVLFDAVLDRSGYRQMLVDAGEVEKDRLQNLDEFKSQIIEYVRSQNEDGEPATLSGFLEETALVADIDKYDETADAVVLMTIHSAKGLEFPIVFLPGMEENLFPGSMTIDAGEAEMEEERRLAYVAITRAKKELYLLHADERLLYGRTMMNERSRFIEEIPPDLIDENKPKRNSVKVGMYDSFFAGLSTPASQKKTYYRENQSTQPSPKPTPQKPATPAETFTAGDRVEHPAFGEGVILSAKKIGSDVLYEVMFDLHGTKKIMGKFAKMKKI